MVIYALQTHEHTGVQQDGQKDKHANRERHTYTDRERSTGIIMMSQCLHTTML